MSPLDHCHYSPFMVVIVIIIIEMNWFSFFLTSWVSNVFEWQDWWCFAHRLGVLHKAFLRVPHPEESTGVHIVTSLPLCRIYTPTTPVTSAHNLWIQPKQPTCTLSCLCFNVKRNVNLLVARYGKTQAHQKRFPISTARPDAHEQGCHRRCSHLWAATTCRTSKSNAAGKDSGTSTASTKYSTFTSRVYSLYSIGC